MRRLDKFSILKWVLAVVLLLIAVFPIWWMFNIVFSPSGQPVSLNPRLYPTSIKSGLFNIYKVLTETQYLNAYMISILYSLLQILGILFVCSMAAFEFALFDFPGKKVLFFIALTSLMVPVAITLIPTYLLVSGIGWINSFQGLVIPGLASAFGLFMLTQFMESLPRDLLRAGEIDGLNHFGLLWYIAIPLSRNALVTLAVLQFIRTWSNFIWPLVVSTRPQWYTISQLIKWYNDPMTYTTVNIIMTANLLATIPTMIFYLIFQRKIIDGVALSGIKG